MENTTYEIINTDDGRRGIKCAGCNRTSWHPSDVQHKWCVCREQTHPIDLNNMRENIKDFISGDKYRSRLALDRIHKKLEKSVDNHLKIKADALKNKIKISWRGF